MWWRTSNCSSLLIYRPREDERLSWPGCLTYSGRLTHISGHLSATGRAQDGERTLARDWRSTAEPHRPTSSTQYTISNTVISAIFTLSTSVSTPTATQPSVGRRNYTVSQKTTNYIIHYNFGKCWPNLKPHIMMAFSIPTITLITHLCKISLMHQDSFCKALTKLLVWTTVLYKLTKLHCITLWHHTEMIIGVVETTISHYSGSVV